MYAVAPLIERAVPLDPPAGDAAIDRTLKDAIKSLRGRRYAPPVTGIAAVRLPSDRAILDRLIESAKPNGWPAEEALAAATTILSRPLYIAPLPDSRQTVAPGRRVRQIALVVAITVDGEIWFGIARVNIEQTVGPKPWTHDSWIEVEWHTNLDTACDILETLYVEAPSHAGLPKLRCGWWVGGGRGTTVPADWKARIAGAGRVGGYDIEVFEALESRTELLHRVSNEQPACLIDWCAYTIGKPQAIVRRYQQTVLNGLYVPLDGVEKFDDALSLLRLNLRKRASALIETPEVIDLGPKTVKEAVEVAIRECGNLVFLDKAESSAKDSEFPRPDEVLAILRILDDVVNAWRLGKIGHDGFAGALIDRGVSGYRSGISDTARDEYRADYERSYNGKEIMLGPHIAKRVGAVTRILRIYWYVDTEAQTFVVGHVGCKLRDESNP